MAILLDCCIICSCMSYLTITHPLNGILCIALGVGLGIFLTLRFKINWRLWWVGVFTFILSQVGHLPFNIVILNPWMADMLETIPDAWRIPLTAVVLGLSAGVFEEFTRYAAYRWWIKDARTWSQGLLFGAGHGGLEAIIIGALSLYTYAQLVALKGADLSTILPVDQISLAQEQISLYWSMPWYDSLLGAIERAFTMPLHLAGAILVLQAFTRQQFRWVWLAVGLHTLVDALAVYLSQTSNFYVAELAIGILAVLEVGLILWLRRSTPIAPAPPPLNPPSSWPVIPIRAVPETPDKLEDTRYQ
jgi:uncharacterized membrane protein YhfC